MSLKFRPWKGTQKHMIESVPIEDGRLLITTDEKKIYVDTRVDGVLQRVVVGEAKNSTEVYNGVFLVNDWEYVTATGTYKQEISIAGITGNFPVIIDLVVSASAEVGLEEQAEWSKITKVVADTGKIIAECYDEAPTLALNFQVKEV